MQREGCDVRGLADAFRSTRSAGETRTKPVARGSLDEQDAGDEGDGDDEGAIVQFAAVSTLSVHDVAPDTVYPELHVGWHVEPLGRVSVQSPTAPFAGGTAASHALSLRTHAAGGPYDSACEPVYDVNSLQASWVQ